MPRWARSCYFDLLALQHTNGSIPADPALCARLLGESLADLEPHWPALSAKFAPVPGDPTRLRNAKLHEISERQLALAATRSSAGKQGGRPRKSGVPAAESIPKANASILLKQNETSRVDKIDMDYDPNESDMYLSAHPTAHKCAAGQAREQACEVAGEPGLEPSPISLLPDPPLPAAAPGALARGSEKRGDARPAPTTKRAPRLPLVDADAEDILSAAWAMVIARHPDLPFTQDAWKRKNRAVAKELSVAGTRATHVTAALRVAYTHPVAMERQWHLTTDLRDLRERWVKLRDIRAGVVKSLGATSASGQDSARRAYRGGMTTD